MSELISLLRAKGVDKDFGSLGLDFDSLFSRDRRVEAAGVQAPGAAAGAAATHGTHESTSTDGIAGRYAGYEWLTKKVPRFGTVINAVPPDEQMDRLPWEEWFVLEGVRHHHVLYLEAPERFDEIFTAPAADDIHPPRTLGKRWYVIEDPDMSPVLLRGERRVSPR